jgi:hypothetical protein
MAYQILETDQEQEIPNPCSTASRSASNQTLMWIKKHRGLSD